MTMPWRCYATWALLACLMGGGITPCGAGVDTGTPTWRIPTADELRARLDDWVESHSLSPETKREIEALWQVPESQPDALSPFERVLKTISLCEPKIDAWIRRCKVATHLELLDVPVEVLQDSGLPDFVRQNLTLFYAQNLASLQLYDEAGSHLAKLDPDAVADPALLLFYRAAVFYRQRDKERGLQTLTRLLEHEDRLPQRFATIARLMHDDLKEYQPDSLDEVARLMDAIRVRLGHGRAGKRVREEEAQVIAKLEKMIEELEKQRQAASGQGGSGGLQSDNPMQDSMPAGGLGQGDVDRKAHSTDTQWGNLPPKEREQVLQQLGRDFPSHYRDVVEEYFRALAREETPAE